MNSSLQSWINRHIYTIVFVGDGAAGATYLIERYTTGHIPTDYIPTVFDNFAVNVLVGGSRVTLG